MAKRFTDTDLWDKEWFMKLSCKQKCLVKMVRDKADLSGVWSPNWIIASAYIGEPVSEKELLCIDEGRQFVKISSGKIFCIGFIEFQYGALSEKSPVHRKIINLLHTHKIDYKHPIYRGEEKEEDKEEEEVKEEEEEKEEPANFEKPEPAQDAVIWPSFQDFWNAYDKKVDRKDCEKKWDKLKQQEKELIMGHVPKYVESTPNKQYRKDPSTYLNNRSWENEIVNGTSKQQTGTSEKEREWREYFAKRAGSGG